MQRKSMLGVPGGASQKDTWSDRVLVHKKNKSGNPAGLDVRCISSTFSSHSFSPTKLKVNSAYFDKAAADSYQ